MGHRSPGIRVVRDVLGTPIRPADLQIGDLVNAVPDGIFDLEGVELQVAKAKAAVIVVKMAPDEIKSQQGDDWDVDGVLCYSKICSHVGCPISLYERTTHHVLCPCHQSTFDLADSAKVVFGPAGRPLPQLPLARRRRGLPRRPARLQRTRRTELLGVVRRTMSIDTSKVADSNTTTRRHRRRSRPRPAPSPPGPTTASASAAAMKKNLRKVFPDHWSFMLGEIALWSFVVLLLSGVFLTLWYVPSMGEVEYQGSYDPLRGVEMSEAYASTLKLSFDVRGGLLMRQMHHWAAMIFVASMMVHLLRVWFTGAFRKPRELNWVIGCLLLLLGTLEGFTGYSLPDDLLSGTGIRAADGFMKATPVVGSYMSFFLFGGEFPGESIIPRLYTVHVLLIPGMLLALIAAHMLLLVYHKHTQWPGPGRTEENVVGFPMLPVYAAKAGGFFFIVFGVTAHHGRPAVDQPGVEVRPLRPDQGHGRLAARLVHGLARRPAAHHPRLGVGDRRLHDLVERHAPDPDHAAADARPR